MICSVSQYTLTVTISEACPKSCETAFTSKFAFNNIVVYECLKSWNLILGRLFSFNNSL